MRFRLGALALCVALCPAKLWAFDLSPDTTRYLSDPSFLPNKGQLESVTTYSYGNTNEDWRRISGVVGQHYLGISNSANQGFYYGITDRLRIGGSASYSETKDKDTYLNGSPNENTSYGFSNPNFNLTYRAIDQVSAPVSVDGLVYYTPGIVQNGSQSGGSEILVSREMKSLTVQVFGGANYFDPTDSAFSSNWQYFGGIADQLRISPHWAVNFGTDFTKSTGYRYNNLTTGIAYTEHHDFNSQPYATLQYAIYPNRIVVGAKYSHDFIGDGHRMGYYNGTWTNMSNDTYSLILRILFF